MYCVTFLRLLWRRGMGNSLLKVYVTGFSKNYLAKLFQISLVAHIFPLIKNQSSLLNLILIYIKTRVLNCMNLIDHLKSTWNILQIYEFDFPF